VNAVPLMALALAGTLGLGGCRARDAASDVTLALSTDPDPPAEGTVSVEVRATDAAGRPMTGGTIRVEGNMSHPGMTPTFAECAEAEPGVYRGPLSLSMPGDWVLEVRASFPGGKSARKSFELRHVRGG
jgi:hypothetical protein